MSNFTFNEMQSLELLNCRNNKVKKHIFTLEHGNFNSSILYHNTMVIITFHAVLLWNMDCAILTKKITHHIMGNFYQHANIKFTSELEENKRISFIDVLVNKMDGLFSTDLYRNPTFTGLGRNWIAQEIINLNSIWYHAYWKELIPICSSYQSLSKEIKYLLRYFCQNGYPVKLAEKQIGTKWDQLYLPPIKPDTVPEQEVYIKIPFMHDSAPTVCRRKLLSGVGIFFYKENKYIFAFSYADVTETDYPNL